MSQRVLIPTNLFYHWADPVPEQGFPPPNMGDVYLNISSHTIRVFYDGGWHDAGGPSGGGGDGGGPAMMIVDTAPPSGVPAGGKGTVWIQY